MNTYCLRQGQVEISVVERQGREFVALGAATSGSHLSGYTRSHGGEISLTTWCGKTMLACRTDVVERYGDGSLALLFRLPRGRFIVGYALGEHGMLFRGELLHDADESNARQTARTLSDHFAELDAEEEHWLDATDD